LSRQINPEKGDTSNDVENEFFFQNLNFYRKQYEQLFKFWGIWFRYFLTMVAKMPALTFASSSGKMEADISVKIEQLPQ